MDTTTKRKELTVADLQPIKLNCEAVLASKVCGFDADLSLRMLGNRAIRIFDAEAGDELSLINERRAELKQGGNQDAQGMEELSVRIKALYEKKVEIEYTQINIDTYRQDGKDFSTGFPAIQQIILRDMQYDVPPYPAFFALMDQGFITISNK